MEILPLLSCLKILIFYIFVAVESLRWEQPVSIWVAFELTLSVNHADFVQLLYMAGHKAI